MKYTIMYEAKLFLSPTEIEAGLPDKKVYEEEVWDVKTERIHICPHCGKPTTLIAVFYDQYMLICKHCSKLSSSLYRFHSGDNWQETLDEVADKLTESFKEVKYDCAF